MSDTRQRSLADPPSHDPVTGVTLLSTYADAERFLRSSDAPRDRRDAERPDRSNGGVLDSGLFTIDGPDHGRLRGLLSRSFSVTTVERVWRPSIRVLVDDLVGRARAHGRADMVQDIALPISRAVLAAVLGIDADEIANHGGLGELIGGGGHCPVAQDPTKSRTRSDEAATALVDRYRRLVAERRTRPCDDLVGFLLRPGPDGDRLTDEEVVAAIHMTVQAGFETLPHALTSAALAMMRNPEEIDHLRAHPEFLPGAVEECLRWGGTMVATTDRTLVVDHEIGSVTLRAGTRVSCALAAADRDQWQFPDPDCFDITRPSGPHLAFGAGPHVCLGAALARCVLREGLRALFIDHDPPRTISQDLDWSQRGSLRTLRSLPIVWDR